MRRRNEEEAYFDWLLEELDIVPGGDGLYEEYYDLLYLLFCTDFRFVIDKDVNRIYDALDLRSQFLSFNFCEGVDLRFCSVLEVLIGLSKRIAEDVLGDEDDKNLKKHWFWTWLYNLSLIIFSGNNFDKNEVRKRVEIWLERRFRPDGFGSPFPLKDAPDDQREDEIWKQVMLYLAENYDSE